MIIRKDQLKLVPSTSTILNSPPEEYLFTNSEDAQFLANILFERMKELGGVGLSANQVGVNATVFVMGVNEVRLDIFNPKIIGESKEQLDFNEGCLSFPGITLDIKRPVSIEVEYQNVKGEKITTFMTGITARIFQHEYDHMLGKTFKTHVSPMKWAMALKKFKNKKEKIVKKYTQKILVDISKEIKNGDSDSNRV